jgi:tetratricopeptide (TPR) repeat protein
MGREFAFKILNAITGMSEELKSSLLNLQGLEFISEKSLFPELEYIFKHALIQEVAYNSLLQKRRKEIHESIGRAIEQMYWDRLEEYYDLLAYHYSRSDNTEKAIHYLELAGDKAVGYVSIVEARRHYQEAIKLLDEQERTESNNRKHITLSVKWAAISMLAPTEEIISTLEKSREYAEELGDDDLFAQVTAHLGACHFFRGNLEQGFTYAQQVLAMSEKLLDDAPVGISYYFLGWAYVFTSNFSDATDCLEKSLPILRRAGYRYFEGYAVATLAYAYGWTGRFHKSFELFLQALEIAETSRLSSVEHLSLFWRGCAKYFKGEWDAAVEDFDLSTPIAEEIEDVMLLAWNWTIKGYALSMGGHPNEGIALTRKGVRTFEETGYKTVVSIAYSFLGEPLCLEGKTEEAVAMAEKAISIGKTGDNFGEIMAYRILAMAAAQESPPNWNKAEENILKSIHLAQERGARPDQAIGHFRFAEILHDKGQYEQARGQLDQATALFCEMEMAWWPEQAESLRQRLEV